VKSVGAALLTAVRDAEAVGMATIYWLQRLRHVSSGLEAQAGKIEEKLRVSRGLFGRVSA